MRCLESGIMIIARFGKQGGWMVDIRGGWVGVERVGGEGTGGGG